ncbi:MAG: sugar ABC transporter permease [Caldilineaceae bacterium]|nr:sugar ABC transporter permease [Caldilineaceae bacterium]
MTTTTLHPSPPNRTASARRWRLDQQWEAYVFLLPSFAGFLLFVILPVLGSFWLSLGELKLSGQFDFLGLSNYRQLQRDPVFWRAVGNTVYFMLTIVPLQLVLGLLIALALNQPLRGKLVYRVIYFMPVVTTIVAGAIVFQMLLNRDYGPISEFFWALGQWTGLPIQPPNFLGDPSWQKPSVVLLTLWKNTGFTMVIYLAALQGVPQELYDAAHVDGASAWQRFRNVTLPLISPTTFFLFVLQMIGAFQLFTEAFVMTRGSGGEPAQATLTVVYYIYQNAFSFTKMGKASAIAWFLFFFIFLFTFIQTRLQRRWVYYEVN